jgi:hypothetical protein
MSAVKGVNATKAADPSPSNILPPGTLGGKKRVMVDKYEAAALASGSTIEIGKALPVGAIVVGVNLSYDALGTSSTLKVGDAKDDDRYLAAASSASAGQRALVLVDGLGYTVTGDTTDDDTKIIITTGGAAITGTISCVIEYVTE